MMRFFVWLSTLFCCWIIVPSTSANSVPSLINYQGRLSNAEGQPVTGQRDVTFSFYYYPTTGSPVWTETQTVQVQNGRFNVLLGSVNPVTTTVFSSPDVYLGVKVGTDAEMQPRSRMASVGYAFKAADAETVNGLRANEIEASPSAGQGFTKYFGSSGCHPFVVLDSSATVRITALVHTARSSTGWSAVRFFDDSSCASPIAHHIGGNYNTTGQRLGSGYYFSGPKNIYVETYYETTIAGELY